MENTVNGGNLEISQSVISHVAAPGKQDNNHPAAFAPQLENLVEAVPCSGERIEDDDEPSSSCETDAEDGDVEDSELDHELVRQEAWSICRVRELAKACARLSGRLLEDAVERAARRITRFVMRMGGFPAPPEPLTLLEAAALQLALQEAMAATAFPHPGEPTAEGIAAVERLAQQAFAGVDLTAPGHADGATAWPGAAGTGAGAGGGGGGEEGISVQYLVRAGPDRLAALSGALAYLLRRTLSPRNCFAVLLLGRCLGSSQLTEAALLACIANFPAAVRADKRHFLLLDDSLLLLITSNSNLQVSEELDVWHSIAEWVQHAWETRHGHLYDLLQAGVRLSHLDTLQLSQLQRHPLLVSQPGPASQLVGAAYSARILSNVHQSRNRQRASGSARTGTGPASSYMAGSGQYGPSAHLPAQQPLPQLQAAHSLRQAVTAQQEEGQQQQQQQQRPKPHAALQQLIGSLQAMAAASRARQQRQQAVAAAVPAGASHGPGQPGGGNPMPSATLSRQPGETVGPTSAAAPASPAILTKQEPESGPGSGPAAAPLRESPPLALLAGARGAGSGLTAQGRPETLAGLSGQLQQQQHPSRPSPDPMTSLSPGGESASGISGGGAGSGISSGVDKRQLASMLAQAIAKAAAKQGLPRIQLSAGGQITPGAVQAALSAAQKQMASNPQLQEMLREAKAQLGQPGQGLQSGPGPQPGGNPGSNSPEAQQHHDEHGPRHPLDLTLQPPPAPHYAGQQQRQGQQQHVQQPMSQQVQQRQAQQQEARHQQEQQIQLDLPGSPVRTHPSPLPRPPSLGRLSSPKPFTLGTTPSGASTSPSPSPLSSRLGHLLMPGSHSQLGQREPGSQSQQPPTALAPQELLQIAAAVQKAVRSGQPQPPHVRQQLQQLQAFISRQLAATPPGSSQQPLLLTLQSMLAGAATSPQAQQPAASTEALLHGVEPCTGPRPAGQAPREQQHQPQQDGQEVAGHGSTSFGQGQDGRRDREQATCSPGTSGGSGGGQGKERGGTGSPVALAGMGGEASTLDPEPDLKRRRQG